MTPTTQKSPEPEFVAANDDAGVIDTKLMTWAPLLKLFGETLMNQPEDAAHGFNYRDHTFLMTAGDTQAGYTVMFGQVTTDKEDVLGVACLVKDVESDEILYYRYEGEDEDKLSDDALLFRADLENILGVPEVGTE